MAFTAARSTPVCSSPASDAAPDTPPHSPAKPHRSGSAPVPSTRGTSPPSPAVQSPATRSPAPHGPCSIPQRPGLPHEPLRLRHQFAALPLRRRTHQHQTLRPRAGDIRRLRRRHRGLPPLPRTVQNPERRLAPQHAGLQVVGLKSQLARCPIRRVRSGRSARFGSRHRHPR